MIGYPLPLLTPDGQATKLGGPDDPSYRVVQVASNGANTTSLTATFGAAMTVGNRIVAFAGHAAGSRTLAISSPGVSSFSQIVAQATSPCVRSMIGTVSASGQTQVTLAPSGSSGFCGLIVVELAGLAGTIDIATAGGTTFNGVSALLSNWNWWADFCYCGGGGSTAPSALATAGEPRLTTRAVANWFSLRYGILPPQRIFEAWSANGSSSPNRLVVGIR